ncbi:MAG: hypothetical protein WCP35_14985 [Verrucomicrobiota bacterium]
MATPPGANAKSTVFSPVIPTAENRAPHWVINGFQLVAAGSATPVATPITYGQLLSASTLTGSFTTAAGLTLPGTLAFTTPAAQPGVGTASQGVTITPSDAANYASGSASVSVTVNPLAVSLSASRDYDATTQAAAACLTVANSVGGDLVSVVSGNGELAAAGAGPQSILSLGPRP